MNLAAAGARLVAAMASGEPVRVSEEVRRTRTAACHACEHYRADGRCRLCGCCAGTGGRVFDKVKYATERCPATPGKW